MGRKEERKFENMRKLIDLLLDHPKGLTRSEIARRLNVHRSTAGEYINDLGIPGGFNVPVYEVSPNQFTIDRDHYQVEISVNIHEAMALHLASRLLTTRTDKHNPHAASALRRLGRELEQLAPLISEHMAKSADILDDDTRRRDPIFLQALETLTRAWSQGIKVRLTHELDDGGIHEYVFSPYFIEPYAVGHTVHVIGFREPINEIRTFKIERIRTIRLLDDQPYTIPENFDPTKHLKDAWGIWFTDDEPELVKLKFTRKVAKRVAETAWHSDQETTTLDDGFLLWEARVANWQEMLPWIRGWGADCEVLAPRSLQKELHKETRKLVQLYLNDTAETRPAHYALWAKTRRKDDEEFHPLLYHLIDVGISAKTLWDDVLSPSTKEQLRSGFSGEMTEEETGNFFAFLAATHDIGKTAPSFQQRHEPSFKRLEKVGFIFPKRHAADRVFHSAISTWALKTLFKDELKMDAYFARRFAHALGGHHGVLSSTKSVERMDDFNKGDEKWAEARLQLFRELQKVFNPPKGIELPENIEEMNMILTLLLGLTTTADWLGSDESFFDYEDRFFSAEEYAQKAKKYAKKALSVTGWSGGWQPDEERKSFGETFAYLNFEAPRSVQKAVIDAAEATEKPTLLILEAPTGIGKTEAALFIADKWLQKEKGRGLYIAMPTQATSNQIFRRTLNFLKNRYPEEKINIQLAHGQAQWNEDAKSLRPTAMGEGANDIEKKLRAESWFLPSKKTLLAPFGVGTVDQALMGALQTRHFYLRLFGLANKVVIFDEVHAYDTYMGKLFLRLLSWLRAIGTSVIVLSATLPEETRREMAEVFCQNPPIEGNQAQYPRVTLATSKKIETIELPPPDDRKIQLKEINPAPEEILKELEKQLAQGGCAAVICNTVQRAQDIYFALQGANFIKKEKLTLFHSRFPPAWRKNIEEKVLGDFGKKGKRPKKAVVVATQVIEQSLDLDFDLMVSDLAPVDLLIQRIGRLHRHKRDARPSGLVAPQMLIARPEGDSSAPDFGSSGYIYAPFILWRSWLTLEGREELNLPSNTTELIETVYGDFNPADFAPEIAKKLEAAQAKMLKDFGVEVYTADRNLIPKPNTEDFVTQPMQDLKDDEDPTLHEQIRAVTRLISPSVNLVCLHKMEDGSLNTEPDGKGTDIDLKRVPNKDEVKELLLHTVASHHYTVVKALAEKQHTKWKRKSALRYHIPMIFENGRCSIKDTKITLILDKELGLQTKKETL